MSLTATCTSICVATAISSVSVGCDLPRGWPGRVRSALPDRLEQPGKEADEYHGADPPDHAAPTNPTVRTCRTGRTERAANAAAPDRAAEAARHAGRGTGGCGRSP